MPRKPSKKTLRNKLDILFSKIVRFYGECERCGTKKNLQCAHIYSRRFVNTRWEPGNAVCLCAGCHHWAHQRPLDFAEWIEEYIGGDIIEEIKRESKVLTRGAFDYEGKLKELQSLWEKMQ